MSLFQKNIIKLHSGQISDFKIECDSLSYLDVECLSYLISKKFKFSEVFGVPSGGIKFENCLKQYCILNSDYPTLIIDDVLTTGSSMEQFKLNLSIDNIIGVVIFARGKCPDWITPIFQFNL